MSDIRVNSVNTFNTSSVGQTGGSGTTPSNVSNPMSEMVQNGAVKDVEIGEKNKRKRELQILAKQFMDEIKANNPIPDCRGAMRDWGVTLREQAAKSKNNIREAQNAVDELLTNLENLPEEEYNKYFESVFGMEPDEYRMESEQNPDFKIKSPSIKVIRAVTSDIVNKQNNTEKQIRQKQKAIIQQRGEENKTTKQGLQDAKDNQGYLRQCCSWFIEHCTGATSQKDVLEALGQDEKDIEELQKIAESGDDVAFNEKYLQMTGVDFRIENFEKMKEIQTEYLKAMEVYSLEERVSSLCDLTEEIERNENKANKWQMNEEDRYSIDFNTTDEAGFEKLWPYSPLENALLSYFSGDKDACREYIDKYKFPDNMPLKERYEYIKNEFMATLDRDITKTTKIMQEKSKEIPYAVNKNKVEELRSKYEQSIKDAYGNNIAKDTLNDYISNVENTYLASKVGVLLAAYALAGPLAAPLGVTATCLEPFAVGGLITAYEGLELGTNKDGFTFDDAMDAMHEGIKFGLYDAVWAGASTFANASNPLKSKIIELLTKKGISPEIASKIAAMSIETPTMFAGDHTVAGIMGDDIDSWKDLLICLGCAGIDAGFLNDTSLNYALWDHVDLSAPLKTSRQRKSSQPIYLATRDWIQQQPSSDDKK